MTRDEASPPVRRGTIDRHLSITGALQLLARWPKLCATTGLVVGGVVFLLYLARPATFQSQATILLRGGHPSPGSLAELTEPRAESAAAEMAILRSRGVAEAAVLDPGIEPGDEAFPWTTVVDDDRHHPLFGLRSLLLGECSHLH